MQAGYSQEEINQYLSSKRAAPTAPAAQPQAQGDFISNLVGSLARPFTNTAKKAGGAIYEGGRLASYLGGNKEAYVKRDATGQASTVQNPFLSEQELGKYSNPLSGGVSTAKDVAGILSYAIPVGGAAKAFGHTSKVLSPLKGGALAGGLFSASDEKATVPSILTGAALGGAGGVLINKLLGTGRYASKLGEGLKKGAIQPKVPKGKLDVIGRQDEILGYADEFGLKGPPESMLSQVDDISKGLYSQYDDVLTKSTRKFKLSELTKRFTKDLGDSLPIDQRGYSSETKILLSKLSKRAEGGDLTSRAVSDWKFKDLGKLSGRFHNKIDVPNSLITPREEVGAGLYSLVDDLIDNAIPESADINLALRKLHLLEPGLRTQLEQVSTLPFLGVKSRVLPKFVQTVQDKTGGALQSGGGKLEQLLSGVNPRVASEVGARALPALFNGQQGETGQAIEEPSVGGANTSQEEAVSQYAITPEMAALAPLLFPPKTANRILQAYELQNQVSGGATATKRINAIRNAENIYNQVEELALEAPAGATGYLQALFGKIPGKEGGASEDLKRTTEGFAKSIAGAFANEVGVATDRDIERWLGLMPKPGDTQAERVRALKRLRQQIDVNKQQLGI